MSASTPNTPGQETTKHRPFVPENMEMKEFTFRAVFLGLVMTVILGAANAYLGLRAGITIAATYPAAVVGMAILRGWKGTVLEENIARTSGTIGEGIAAGAIFTIPAFLMAGVWPSFGFRDSYLKTTALIIVGSVLGVLFISLVRKGMVEDPELPFPESVAASEIHKAGRRGAQAAKYLFWNIGVGGIVYILGALRLYDVDKVFPYRIGELGRTQLRLGGAASTNFVATGGVSTIAMPEVSPALLGVGYIIGFRLAALQFAGSVAAWGVLVPLIIYFLGPSLKQYLPANAPTDWIDMADSVWRYIVKPIAVGGMLVGSAYTLYRMKDSLVAGMGKAFADLRRSSGPQPELSRTERYMSFKTVFALIGVTFVLMCILYIYVAYGAVKPALVAAFVMLIVGFFFATVSGSLCGVIGSSNNPVSGITLSTLLIAGLLMVGLGVTGKTGVATVLGVAAVVCVSSSVAGELLQDFKVGYILGGTPSRIQTAELIAVVVASLVMYFPLHWLQKGFGFGSEQLPAPQAGLMATLAGGIVAHNVAWPLVWIGVFLGIAMIMMGVRNPMLAALGMYLPFNTTFAIFVGGCLRLIGEQASKRRNFTIGQKARVGNAGVLIASGLIAGESLMGLLYAGLKASVWAPPKLAPEILKHPSYLVAAGVLATLAALLIFMPLTSAGDPNEPPPPAAIM